MTQNESVKAEPTVDDSIPAAAAAPARSAGHLGLDVVVGWVEEWATRDTRDRELFPIELHEVWDLGRQRFLGPLLGELTAVSSSRWL